METIATITTISAFVAALLGLAVAAIIIGAFIDRLIDRRQKPRQMATYKRRSTDKRG